jgi:hypothetical protein
MINLPPLISFDECHLTPNQHSFEVQPCSRNIYHH